LKYRTIGIGLWPACSYKRRAGSWPGSPPVSIITIERPAGSDPFSGDGRQFESQAALLMIWLDGQHVDLADRLIAIESCRDEADRVSVHIGHPNAHAVVRQGILDVFVLTTSPIFAVERSKISITVRSESNTGAHARSDSATTSGASVVAYGRMRDSTGMESVTGSGFAERRSSGDRPGRRVPCQAAQALLEMGDVLGAEQ
jgi:hypothetical protein